MAILNKFQMLQEMLERLPLFVPSPSRMGIVDGVPGLLWSFIKTPEEVAIIFVVIQNSIDKQNDYGIIMSTAPSQTEWVRKAEWYSFIVKTKHSPWVQNKYQYDPEGVDDAV